MDSYTQFGYYRRKAHVLCELLAQYIRHPNVAIIGSVHGNNVGDMALSRSVKNVVDEYTVRSGRQLIGGGRLGLANWPLGKRAIVAGGALGREKVLRTVVQKYSAAPGNVALAGMSFWSFDDLSEKTLQFLQATAYLSCRNRKDVRELRKRGIEATFAYDNAFSLAERGAEKEEGLLGVNVVPRHMKMKNGKYVPSESRPKFSESYVNMMCSIAKNYLSKGWRVVHVPFTSQDAALARQVFKGMGLYCRNYTSNVEETDRAVATCSRFIGARYHSHVFALKSSVPLYSVSYARKCRHLREELDIPARLQATRENIVEDPDAVVNRFTTRDGFVLSDEKRNEIDENARGSIEAAARSIGIS